MSAPASTPPSSTPPSSTPPAGSPPEAAPLRTGSLRLRLSAAVIVVLGLVLVLLGIAVDAAFSRQADANLDALLTGRAQLARQLARSGLGPQQVVNRVQTDGVQAQLVLRTGETLGSVAPPSRRLQSRTVALGGSPRLNGSELTLTVDTSLVDGARSSLRRVLLVTGLVALVLGGLGVAVAVPLALAPVAAMGVLAQRIAAGRRGTRLAPTRPDTDLGRTAQAFDGMLDALEGAEARARAAETRTRTFLADAAHELRTPLTGVRAGAETLLQHGDQLDPGDRERLQVLVVREAERASRLVEDLLAAARLDAGLALRCAPVDLLGLARAEVEQARLRQPGTPVRVEGTDVVVWADAERVAAVLRNLLDNALRAVRDGGEVALDVAVDGDVGVVEVVDTGPGIDAADSERVFERLVRLDAARSADAGGSGLGLAIARGYARAHGGDLVHRPERHPGATFRLTLPRSGADARGGPTPD